MAHFASDAACPVPIAVLMAAAYITIGITFGGSPNPPPSLGAFFQRWWQIWQMRSLAARSMTWSDCAALHNQRCQHQSCQRAGRPPLVQAFLMAVYFPDTHTAQVIGFIKDLINYFLDTQQNRAKQPHVVLLAMHCISRPHVGGAKPIT
jgi:hypothetical protein